MQDEVRDKSVALVIRVGKNGGKLTAELLRWAIRQYQRQANAPQHGKQSVKSLVGQGTAYRISRSRTRISNLLSGLQESTAWTLR